MFYPNIRGNCAFLDRVNSNHHLLQGSNNPNRFHTWGWIKIITKYVIRLYLKALKIIHLPSLVQYVCDLFE